MMSDDEAADEPDAEAAPEPDAVVDGVDLGKKESALLVAALKSDDWEVVSLALSKLRKGLVKPQRGADDSTRHDKFLFLTTRGEEKRLGDFIIAVESVATTKAAGEEEKEAVGDAKTPAGTESRTMLEYCSAHCSGKLFFAIVKHGFAPTDVAKQECALELLYSKRAEREKAQDEEDEEREESTMYQLTYLSFIADRNIVLHARAAEWYAARHYRYFFLPCTILTSVAAFLSFLSTSNMLRDEATTIAIVVGALSAVSTALQSFSDTLAYNSQANQHSAAAHEYRAIMRDLEFKGTASVIEGASKVLDNSVLQEISKQMKQIHSSCKSKIPTQLEAIVVTPSEEIAEMRTSVIETNCGGTAQSYCLVNERLLTDLHIINQTLLTYRHPWMPCLRWPWFVDVACINRRVLERVAERACFLDAKERDASLPAPPDASLHATYFKLARIHESIKLARIQKKKVAPAHEADDSLEAGR